MHSLNRLISLLLASASLRQAVRYAAKFPCIFNSITTGYWISAGILRTISGMKYFVLFTLMASACFAEAPKVTVVQTEQVTCNVWNALIPGTCRPTVVVIIESKEAGDKFLVGLRYLNSDGEEIIEARYPVSGGSIWFSVGDVRVLGATAASLRTNEVGVWQR